MYYLNEDLQLSPGPRPAHFPRGQEEKVSDKENNKGGNLQEPF